MLVRHSWCPLSPPPDYGGTFWSSKTFLRGTPCVYIMLHAPRIWIRKVDDTFTINNHETNDTLNRTQSNSPPNKVHCRGGGEWPNSFLGLFSIEN